jgi:osmoprotectant transport system substrate-binding protein
MRLTPRWTTALVALALTAAACGGDGDAESVEGPTITVGSADFAESRILAQIYAQALEAEGYDVEVRENIGPREVTFPAMGSGELDLMPEYTGNALLFALGEGDTDIRDRDEVAAELQSALEEDGLMSAEYSPAEDVDGLAVTRETAEEHGLEQISDIADFPGTFRFGGGPECEERISCFRGYLEVYGFDNMEFVSLDSGGPITVEALNAGEVDGANLFTTQSVVAANDFVLLEDDQELQLPQNIVPVFSQSLFEAYGEDMVAILDRVSETLDTETLTDLNVEVEIEQRDPRDVAADWLEENGFTGE